MPAARTPNREALLRGCGAGGAGARRGRDFRDAGRVSSVQGPPGRPQAGARYSRPSGTVKTKSEEPRGSVIRVTGAGAEAQPRARSATTSSKLKKPVRVAIHSAARTAPRAKPRRRAGAVLEQDLVAAGVEADRVLADDAARAHGRPRGSGPRPGQRARRAGVSGLRRPPAAACARIAGQRPCAVPEGASFFWRWCRSSDVRVVVGEAGEQRRRVAHDLVEEVHARARSSRRGRGRRRPRRPARATSGSSVAPAGGAHHVARAGRQGAPRRWRPRRPARVKSMPTGQPAGKPAARATITGSWPRSRSTASTSRPIAVPMTAPASVHRRRVSIAARAASKNSRCRRAHRALRVLPPRPRRRRSRPRRRTRSSRR